MDFDSDALYDGRRLRARTVTGNDTRECLVIEVDQGIGGEKVVGILERITMERRTPKTIRVDDGPELVSKVLDQWAYRNGVKLDFSWPESQPTTRMLNRLTVACETNGRTQIGPCSWKTLGARSRLGSGTLEDEPPPNSPMKSRLAAISLRCRQPKTHLRVGAKKAGPIK
jgi:hypothetical protein